MSDIQSREVIKAKDVCRDEDEDEDEDEDSDDESIDNELQEVNLQHDITLKQEKLRRQIYAFKTEHEIRSKFRGICCFCIDNTIASKRIQYFDVIFFINPFRMIPAVIALSDRRKYKKYSKARMDSFSVLWVLMSLGFFTWLITDMFYSAGGGSLTLEEIG